MRTRSEIAIRAWIPALPCWTPVAQLQLRGRWIPVCAESSPPNTPPYAPLENFGETSSVLRLKGPTVVRLNARSEWLELSGQLGGTVWTPRPDRFARDVRRIGAWMKLADRRARSCQSLNEVILKFSPACSEELRGAWITLPWGLWGAFMWGEQRVTAEWPGGKTMSLREASGIPIQRPGELRAALTSQRAQLSAVGHGLQLGGHLSGTEAIGLPLRLAPGLPPRLRAFQRAP